MDKAKIQFKLISSLQKVFSKEEPKETGRRKFSVLRGETFSFQVAFKNDAMGYSLEDYPVTLEIGSALAKDLKVHVVAEVPSSFPAHAAEDIDENYLKTEVGLYPDILLPFSARFGKYKSEENKEEICLSLTTPFRHWRSLWLELPVFGQAAGRYHLPVSAKDKEQNEIWQDYLEIEIIDKTLEELDIVHTEWFHADCLADYYGEEVFSEKHWQIIENFMKTAAESGINTILTPIFTLPLDTRIGGERTTHQLIEITKTKEGYSFNLDNLDRWLETAFRSGMKYIEFAHLFTQWGAKAAPKIIAKVDGKEKKIFGWETTATSKEYIDFLRELLTTLKEWIYKRKIEKRVIFHISDEPHDTDKENYLKAKNSIIDIIAEFFVTDALSDYKLYQEGVVENPVVATNHIDYFIEQGAKNLWAYYCCSQKYKVANRFMAMPSVRNRILGLQLYRFDMKGFLHWGYNFYNSQYSLEQINPYQVTDAGGAFPSGDAFLVYPAKDGQAHPSIRLKVLAEAFYDYRALKTLEHLVGKEKVIALLTEETGADFSFQNYPQDEEFVWKLREKVNHAIKHAMK